MVSSRRRTGVKTGHVLLAVAVCFGCSNQTTAAARAPETPDRAISQTIAGLSKDVLSARVEQRSGDDGWLRIDIATTSSSEWEAALLAGAVADRTAGNRQLAAVIKGYRVYRATNNDGEPSYIATNALNLAGERFRAPGDDAKIKRVTAAALATYGATPVSIDVLHPLDHALKVVATVPTPEAMNGKLGQLQAALVGTPPQYEGVYLELRLFDGSTIATLWTTYRNVIGSQSIRPDLEAALGGPAHA